MGSLKFPHTSGNSMSIAAPATNPASDLELKLPATIGTAGQVLKNSSTAGTLEFGAAGNTPHAWANITLAGSHTITAGEGFSSIADDGNGVSALTLSTALSSTDDVCVVSNQILVSTGSETWVLIDPSVPTTTRVTVDCREVDNDAPSMVNTDPTRAMIVVMTTP